MPGAAMKKRTVQRKVRSIVRTIDKTQTDVLLMDMEGAGMGILDDLNQRRSKVFFKIPPNLKRLSLPLFTTSISGLLRFNIHQKSNGNMIVQYYKNPPAPNRGMKYIKYIYFLV